MAPTGGPSRAGARRGTRSSRGPVPRRAALRLTGAVVGLLAWGVLVGVAIHQGRTARGGDDTAWWWLALASVGAVACLFGALMLATTALRETGVLAPRADRRH